MITTFLLSMCTLEATEAGTVTETQKEMVATDTQTEPNTEPNTQPKKTRLQRLKDKASSARKFVGKHATSAKIAIGNKAAAAKVYVGEKITAAQQAHANWQAQRQAKAIANKPAEPLSKGKQLRAEAEKREAEIKEHEAARANAVKEAKKARGAVRAHSKEKIEKYEKKLAEHKKVLEPSKKKKTKTKTRGRTRTKK